MNPSLAISKSGMNSLQVNLDVVSNNVANSNTVGFKEQNTNFQELLREDVSSRNQLLINGISRGTKAELGQFNLTQGGLIATSNDYDLALVGDGFFGVRLTDNELVYTRDGSFRMDASGTLRTSSGEEVEMTYNMPKGQWPTGKPIINEQGQITIQNQIVGQISIFDSNQFEQMNEIGGNLYRFKEGEVPILVNPVIKQHYLETSNVDLATSMTDMIVTQRAYSLNAKVIQSTDDMMQIINNFKQ